MGRARVVDPVAGRRERDDRARGVAALAVILGLRFSAPRVPGALVLVVGGLLATPLFDLDAHGVALVGDVPRGLPTPVPAGRRRLHRPLPTIVAAAAGLLLIGFSQTAGDARAFAARHRYRIDVNQESVAQGMANVAAGAFRGMPVSTSLSASSLNESAGARTPLASLVTGVLVLLTLIALAPLFSELPKAVLAAIIIDAVVFGMIDIPELRRLCRVKRVRLLGGGRGDRRRALGRRAGRRRHRHRALARLARVRRRPRRRCRCSVASREPRLPRRAREPGDETFPGYAVVRLDGGLFFATAEALEERVRELAQDADPPLRAVVLDMEGVDFVDSQGAAMLAEILDFTESADVRLSLARVKPAVARCSRATASWSASGADRVHASLALAVEAQLAADPRRAERSADGRAEGEPVGDQPVPEAAVAHEERVAAELRQHRAHDAGAREDHLGAVGLQPDDRAPLLGGRACGRARSAGRSRRGRAGCPGRRPGRTPRGRARRRRGSSRRRPSRRASSGEGRPSRRSSSEAIASSGRGARPRTRRPSSP